MRLNNENAAIFVPYFILWELNGFLIYANVFFVLLKTTWAIITTVQ